MQAVQFSRYGGPEVLEVVETDAPHPGAGQVRIAVRAAGVNAMDWKRRSGLMRDQVKLRFPATVGLDAAGVIDEVGENVTDVAVGDAVFGTGSGAYAEFAVLKKWALKPQPLSFEEAAGYPVPVETAVRILDEVGVQRGQTLLVSGAAGGVGSAVLQFARERGITVIGTAGERNQEYLRSLGAAAVVYGEGLPERVRSIAPDGVDAALDLAGSGVLPELIELTGDVSKVITIADFAAGPEFGVRVSSRSTKAPGAYVEAARLASEGRFSIPVAATFSMADAGAAHEASRAGHVAGRFIIAIG